MRLSNSMYFSIFLSIFTFCLGFSVNLWLIMFLLCILTLHWSHLAIFSVYTGLLFVSVYFMVCLLL